MNDTLSNHRVDFVSAALAQNAHRLADNGKGSWRMQPRAGADFYVDVKLADNWLLLSAHELPQLIAEAAPMELVRRNTGLPGLVKFAPAPAGGARLCAELPLLDDSPLAGRVREICEGFASGAVLYEFSAPAGTAGDPAGLAQLARETGWPFVERGAEKIFFELETPGQFWQAALVPDGRGVRLFCELAAGGAPAGECREALAEFMFLACGAVRLARAVVADDSARLEAAFPSPPVASEISNVLEVLSAGLQLCGEEVKTLQSPAIARRYLELRGSRAALVA